MDYQEKVKKFRNKNTRESFRNRTPIDELPIQFTLGSSSHTPEQKVQIETSDLVLWCKFLDVWFRPYGGFSYEQIMKMVEVCENDLQVESLMEMLSSTDQ